MATLPVPGRAGKRCWGSERRQDSRERHARYKAHKQHLPQLSADEKSETSSNRKSGSRRILGRLASPAGEEVSRFGENFPERSARGKADLWKTRALPLLAPCISISAGRGARQESGGDNCCDCRAGDECGAGRRFPFQTISSAAGRRAFGSDDHGIWPREYGFTVGCVLAARVAEIHGIQRRIAGGSGLFGIAVG